MAGKKFWQDLTYNPAPIANDKLLLGNSINGETQYTDILKLPIGMGLTGHVDKINEFLPYGLEPSYVINCEDKIIVILNIMYQLIADYGRIPLFDLSQYIDISGMRHNIILIDEDRLWAQSYNSGLNHITMSLDTNGVILGLISKNGLIVDDYNGDAEYLTYQFVLPKKIVY